MVGGLFGGSSTKYTGAMFPEDRTKYMSVPTFLLMIVSSILLLILASTAMTPQSKTECFSYGRLTEVKL